MLLYAVNNYIRKRIVIIIKLKDGGVMIEIRGKYNTAKVFTDNVEEYAIAQIIELCNQEFAQDSNK